MKVLCVGPNQTGTTLLEHLLMFLGYRLGDQPSDELLLGPGLAASGDRLVLNLKDADAAKKGARSWRSITPASACRS
jgi:hypothetical protein